ncbi:hypothetical protein O181_031643 [Austropuccinia psidii MF-1]|uniref:Phenylalanine ammonia-lyase n=1 Tax=Austropuccinia psidii MF-1 TaxID=1389203 RepID=A0A9Q3CXW5_9BASI|nr:hypothetical protein [Austropuccinia psidii MF-1]
MSPSVSISTRDLHITNTQKSQSKPSSTTQNDPVVDPHAQHTRLCIASLEELDRLTIKLQAFVLDGHHLTPSSVVATARYPINPIISNDPKILQEIQNTVEFLASKLDTSIYGVTTGFGGSADTRSESPIALQMAFLEHQLSGVLPILNQPHNQPLFSSDCMSNVMPEAITRGAILIRINSLLRGHSAVRLCVLETLLQLLNKHLTPMVPLRGSISASGDLMPLSYVAAAICGNSNVQIIDRSSKDGHVEVLPASAALAKHGITPITLGPKEALGISNGTAFAASAACLAAHDAHLLALLAQVLTSLTTEAMMGQVGNFHPFIHETCRPHPGQIEVARNIRNMLKGSLLATQTDEECKLKNEKGLPILRQDRYPLRTSPQWLGPQIEELINVHKTLALEINSTTDNPLIDLSSSLIHNGGNFQAMALTNAMEKTRSALESIGKLSFSQATELTNCAMNKGLASCLAGDEPSTNYHVKGLDINMAAYTAELGFLASPVANYVQSAEQHNQAVNSLALISARFTIQAIEVLSMQLSAHLYVACMAIDLRVMDQLFRKVLYSNLAGLLKSHFNSYPTEAQDALFEALVRRLEITTTLDSEARFLDAYKHTLHALLEYPIDLTQLHSWPAFAGSQTTILYQSFREKCFSNVFEDSVSAWIGPKNWNVYNFVRKCLGILPRRGDVFLGQHLGSISSDVSKIFESIRCGELFKILKDVA